MLLDMDRLLRGAQPNPAHYALAQLEQRGILKGIVTQNVDSLHQRAGSRNVVEFHGDGRQRPVRFLPQAFPREELDLGSCRRFVRAGPIRPNFVFFGEGIPFEAQNEAFRMAERCDVLLVVGTSATVAPASHLPIIAKGRGAFIIEINPQESELTRTVTDIHIDSTRRSGPARPRCGHGPLIGGQGKRA